MDFLFTIETILNDIISSINGFLWSYILIITLIGVGLYFTIKTGGVQLKSWKDMFSGLKKNKSDNDQDGKSKISPLQSLLLATAVRVGTGNIAGVAIAISLGGPGAVLWMWLIAIIGGASSFIESTLGQIFKSKDSNGEYVGGPSYYMQKALNKRWMGIIFSILVVFCYGLAFNSVQSNTILATLKTQIPAIAEDINTGYIIAMLISVLFAIVIFGGVKSVAIASSFLVPVMAVIYISIVAFIILTNFEKVPAMFTTIFQSAFNFGAVGGGVGGGIFVAMLQGVKRGLFSNEAGMGGGAIAAATANVSHPVKQGFVQTLGVYLDTLVICSTTAFLILITDSYKHPDYEGVQIVQYAFSNQVGMLGSLFFTGSIFLFAFTSMIANYYYGEASLSFIFNKFKRKSIFIYRLIAIFVVFIGAISQLSFVWNFADLTMGLLAIINIIAILLLGKIALNAYKHYCLQKSQNLDPRFSQESIELNVDSKDLCWPEK